MNPVAEHPPRPGLYVGLISGTSMDGVDAALLRIDESGIVTVGSLTNPYPDSLASRLTELVSTNRLASIDELASLHIETGAHFALTARRLLADAGVSAKNVIAIGSHGQTLRHSPDSVPAYSWQIGDAATIAARCEITTVADFRSLDVAYGGQGAPLVPAFHAASFRADTADRAVVNIGGISNVTLLPRDPDQAVSGYDTGPGNCLMDEWCTRFRGAPYDENGRWAESGHVSESLLDSLMSDPYLRREPPKSTGRETFNLNLVDAHLVKSGTKALAPQDVQATLLAFTAKTIAAEIVRPKAFQPDRVYVCGGGVHNDTLLGALRSCLPGIDVVSTANAGIDPDMVEACTFGWLAALRIAGCPVALATSTHSRSLLLGAIYEPTPGTRS